MCYPTLDLLLVSVFSLGIFWRATPFCPKLPTPQGTVKPPSNCHALALDLHLANADAVPKRSDTMCLPCHAKAGSFGTMFCQRHATPAPPAASLEETASHCTVSPTCCHSLAVGDKPGAVTCKAPDSWS